MDAHRNPLVEMRARVSKTPLALEPYDAFEGLLRTKLLTWPKLSADRAAGFIMSAWVSDAAKAGRIRIPKSDLHWIINAGKLCRRKLKGAEPVWAKELAAHLLRIGAETKPETDKAPAPSAVESAPS